MSDTRNFLRSQQFPAVLLLVAAALGILLANLPSFGPIDAVLGFHIAIPGTGIDLSVAHWISDGLLAIFFFVVAMELQYELTRGELNSFGKALQPAIAAAGGVLVPIIIYLVIAGRDATASGWPIPTATDIAFALGVLAVFGKGLPAAVRVFLLALAILDDIIGIVFIAVLFAHDLNWLYLVLAIVGVVAFGFLSRMLPDKRSWIIITAMIIIGVVVWALVLLSGIHATIAGVMLGLAIAQSPSMRARHVLEPWVNGAILPIFAFAAAFVVIPAVSPSELSPAFFGIAVALPLGKIIGITAFGWIAIRIGSRGRPPALTVTDLLAAGTLGGIGFTVSLLLANLAFASDPATRDQAILGVLVGSLISVVLAGIVVSARAAWHRRVTAASS
ncbi:MULTISPECIES: Na+/H+ antiporter NhaA [unclassified Microbacterium]|uniref:Na+/H+ antiporter NhaA n=1 Tax=unclassified Microbacterium TaxID=2609290 RepID=UPI002CBE9367|nr:Na+/H+ antiporter NhaA [Microbacterium sp.]HWK77085.1 Na+/H+ antiporter NhaA [Microbacterium sp.]